MLEDAYHQIVACVMIITDDLLSPLTKVNLQPPANNFPMKIVIITFHLD